MSGGSEMADLVYVVALAGEDGVARGAEKVSGGRFHANRADADRALAEIGLPGFAVFPALLTILSGGDPSVATAPRAEVARGAAVAEERSSADAAPATDRAARGEKAPGIPARCRKCGKEPRPDCRDALVEGGLCDDYVAMLREVVAPHATPRERGARDA